MAVRVGKYTRVSTDMQYADGISIQEQNARLDDEIAQHSDWELCAEYTDGGYSGQIINRPALQRCIKDVESGKIDLLIVLDIDRAHRNEDNRRWFEQFLSKHRVQLIYLLEPKIERESLRTLMRDIRGAFSAYFAGYVSDTVRDKKRYLAKLGRRPGGYAPYGLIEVDGHLAKDPETYAILLEIYERFARGEGIPTITRWLNESHIPSPELVQWTRKPINKRGEEKPRPHGAWPKISVQHILRNPVYIGTLAYGIRSGRHHGYKKQPADQNIFVPNAWEAFIPQELWDKVRQHDTARVRRSPSSWSTFLLSGNKMMRCAECGRAWTGYQSQMQYRNRKGKKVAYQYRAYRCVGRTNYVGSCKAPMVQCTSFDRSVIQTLVQYFREDRESLETVYNKVGDLLCQRERETRNRLGELAGVRDEYAEQHSKLILATARALAEGYSTDLVKQFEVEANRFEGLVRQVEDEIAELRYDVEHVQDAREELARANLAILDMVETLPDQPLEEQRQLIRALLGEIRMDSSKGIATLVVKNFFVNSEASLHRAYPDLRKELIVPIPPPDCSYSTSVVLDD